MPTTSSQPMTTAQKKTIIQTPNAPAAIGTYSQAVMLGETLYLSGQIPIDPKTGKLVGADIESQIHQTFQNIEAVLTTANKTFNNLIQLRIYLLSLTHFETVNKIMATYVSQPYPARAAIGVNELPKGALIEIEGIAH